MLDYPVEVNATFVSWYSDSRALTNSQKMNLCYDMAKLLLSNWFSHLINNLNQKAADQHKADIDEWSLMLQDVSAAKDISQYVLLLFLDFVDSSLPQ
jgi:hypothetical protein